ncbi:2-desacetyl-2-hydroxyethyl bacteriochlorophyllide A dehydrogenase [Arthrobacter oryzae]|uniref:zinc-dependent alcohol dehydrogenase n=1 Tax=Arthrobacter oryzae TaxID=409290 RepID=UPI0027864F00|nr:alcohol dehydrogenase catalytic domain-containing protein [Arthrobacter oryzae]MDP9987440.1 2-desacetyl-2-hydroxyethyl bacteriochlorophyllide A dehydrogenase [Arthrobacter oryzae]
MNTREERRRILVTKPNTIEIRKELTPGPGEGEVRIDLIAAGICGSDNSAAAGHHPMVPLPYYPGHEVVGVISEVGSGVSAAAPGQRVTVNPPLPCQDCKMCRTNRSNLCENMRFFGCGWEEGGMADSFIVPASRLYPIPREMTDEQAALIEPLATPVHAARLAGDLQSKAVVIQGAGTIGLFMLAAVRAAGAENIIVTDILEDKLNKALSLGAKGVVSALSENLSEDVRMALGESADVVFDCVSTQKTIQSAIEMAMKGGTVVVVGVPHGSVNVPLHIIQDQQMQIQGAATYLAEDYDDAAAMIMRGQVNPNDFITATFPLDHAEDAFKAATSGKHTKILVTP